VGVSRQRVAIEADGLGRLGHDGSPEDKGPDRSRFTPMCRADFMATLLR
jgi:hypothetical protein